MSNSYMTRAMQHSDPRYVEILTVLGYGTREAGAVRVTDLEEQPDGSRRIVAQRIEVKQSIAELRAEYERLYSKRPSPRMKAETLRAKIAAAKSQ